MDLYDLKKLNLFISLCIYMRRENDFKKLIKTTELINSLINLTVIFILKSVKIAK